MDGTSEDVQRRGDLSGSVTMDIRKIFDDSGLINPGDSLLVALSGGKDSVFLLQALVKVSRELALQKIGAVHVNHKLRGAESDGDEAFCRSLCASLRVPFYSERVNVKYLALLWKLSLEETGRKVRYAVLSRIAERSGYDKIVTAHTLDDQAETLLFRLAKGCGLEGVAGIREMRGKIIRPLLTTETEAIVAWLEENGISYRTDQTNTMTTFERNLIRHEALPVLRKINPRYREALLRFRSIATESSSLLDEYTEILLKERFKAEESGYFIDIRGLSPAALKMLVKKIARDSFGMTLSWKDLSLIDEMVRRGVSGKRLALSRDWVVHLNYDRLFFKPPEGFFSLDAFEIKPGRNEIPSYNLTIEMSVVGEYPYQVGENEYLIPESLCHKESLCARTRRRGDFFIPAGGKRKKMKKYLNDLKIPRVARDNLIMIADKERIWAIVGICEGEGVNEPGRERYIRIKAFRDEESRTETQRTREK
ncbi:tRNA lysidine(34) synthetase TilS [Candidatus Mcinerneyibacteriota bacterium]|nr:tRNA lysidine(34) synthetase TilS [Candidatus Mcinerneyibacteriota bacterium]